MQNKRDWWEQEDFWVENAGLPYADLPRIVAEADRLAIARVMEKISVMGTVAKSSKQYDKGFADGYTQAVDAVHRIISEL